MNANTDSNQGCIHCPGASFDDPVDRARHMLEEHGTANCDGLKPGEFPEAAEDCDTVKELSKEVGLSLDRTCQYLGAYGLADEFVGDP